MVCWNAQSRWRVNKRCSRRRFCSCQNHTRCCTYGILFIGHSVTLLLCSLRFTSFLCSCWAITRGSKMKSILLLAVVASLVLGCKNDPRAKKSEAQSSEDGIRTAIQAHLAHKGTLNLQAFDTDVKQVTIQGDHAQAEVEFRLKGGPGAMQLTYA